MTWNILVHYTAEGMDCIDNKAKCRHLKTFTCKGTLRQVFICLRPIPSYDPIPPPLHIVYVYTVYLFTQGWGGGGRELTREKVRGASVHNAGSKITTSPINTCRKVPLQVNFFRWRHFALVSILLGPPGCAQVFPYLSPGPLDFLVVW
jgi:hypothetical protein